jgi:crotonobetainyl-CoA:carnitine CoA-transferase CaiB-like acyl-CoA transferase
VPCGRILTLDMLEREANLVHRETVHRLDDPETLTSARVPASPIRGTPLQGLKPSRIPARDGDRATVLRILSARTQRAADTRAAERPAHVEALAGVRVVEIGHYTVAPLASRYMGAFGADVIKVEPPQGDAIRHGAPRAANGVSYIFALSNTDKRGLVLDLRQDRDKARLNRLLEQSDLLIENLRPGTLEKLGFGPTVLRECHPHLVYCAITGFGSDSTYRDRPALDTVIQAMSGIMSLTCVDGMPLKAGISISDVTGGLFGLLASLAGIEYRDRTGRAVHFDISMQDASVWLTQVHWSTVGRPAVRLTRARDGYVVVDGDANTIEASMATLGGTPDRSQLVAHLSARGLAAAPVLKVTEVLDASRTAARQLIVECRSKDNDSWRVHNCPLRLSSTPPRVRTVMSRLGLNNDQIIDELQLDEQPQERTTCHK